MGGTMPWSDAAWEVNAKALTGSASYKMDSGVFHVVGLKLSDVCESSAITVAASNTLYHARSAYSLDGKTWTCYTQFGDVTSTDCSGQGAPIPSGSTFVFPKAAQYVEIGFRFQYRANAKKTNG